MSSGRVINQVLARATCLIVLGGGTAVRAGELWTGGTAANDNKWTTAANWMPAGAPANDGTANIVMMGPMHPVSEVDVPWSINSLQFPAGAVGFSLDGTSLTIGAGGIQNLSTAQSFGVDVVAGADQVWNGASPLLFNGGISGAFGVTKTGGNYMVYQGPAANTYTGTTLINSGQLLLNKTPINGAVPGNLVIGDGVGVDVVQLYRNEQITEAPGTLVTMRSSARLNLAGFSETIFALNMTGGQVASGVGMLSVLDSITTNANATSALIQDRLSFGGGIRPVSVADGAALDDLVISAAVSSGGLIKQGAGTLRMSGAANTYQGTTTVREGMLVLAKTGADGAIRGDLVIGGGSAPSATVMLSGAEEQIAAIGNTVTIEPNGVLILALTPPPPTDVTETIGDLVMTGGRISGDKFSVQGEVNTLAWNDKAMISAGMNLGGIARTFNIADGSAAVDLEVSGRIWNGGLIKSGPGTLMLSGAAANGSVGMSTVNQGTLLLNKSVADGAIVGNLVIGNSQGPANSAVVRLAASEQIAAGATSTVTVNASGLLDLAGNVETIMGLTMSGGNVDSGAASGMLTVMGEVASNASMMGATISGRLDLGGGNRTFRIAEGAAMHDLRVAAAISGGGITKMGAGALTISGPQSYAPGAVMNVMAGRVNLNSDSGVPATAGAAADAKVTLRIEGSGASVALGADQDLAGLEVLFANGGSQGLNLNSPAGAGAYRSVRVYAADLPAAKAAVADAIRNANAAGAIDPLDGIFDSGLSAHAGARVGSALLNDVHGDPHLLIRPTRIGDLNLDGIVTIADFIDLASNFNLTATASWQEGDLNSDGSVTISDFIDLASNFGSSYGGGAGAVSEADRLMVEGFAAAYSVPEPGVLGIAFCGLGMMARRRRGRFSPT